MANNIHVSYTLGEPARSDDAIVLKIKELGSWAKINSRLWYVSSVYTAREAANHIITAMSAQDELYVVDATHNSSVWNALPKNVDERIRTQWFK